MNYSILYYTICPDYKTETIHNHPFFFCDFFVIIKPPKSQQRAKVMLPWACKEQERLRWVASAPQQGSDHRTMDFPWKMRCSLDITPYSQSFGCDMPVKYMLNPMREIHQSLKYSTSNHIKFSHRQSFLFGNWTSHRNITCTFIKEVCLWHVAIFPGYGRLPVRYMDLPSSNHTRQGGKSRSNHQWIQSTEVYKVYS